MCSDEHLHFDYVRLAWDIGFCFEELEGKNLFDMSIIGLVDVDKVARERDIATVEKHIPTLLNFKLDQDLSRVLEPNFLKIFKLSQLAIQYLRFCKRYLDNTVAILKKDFLLVREDKEDLEQYIEELKVENETLRKKYLELQETVPTTTFKCEDCHKTFYSEEYLLAHIKRRHNVGTSATQMQSEADKLQLEIKELKQRLNNTEKFIQNDKSSSYQNEKESVEPNNDVALEQTMQFKFEQLKTQIEKELNSLRSEGLYKEICEKVISDVSKKQAEKENVTNEVPVKRKLSAISTQTEVEVEVNEGKKFVNEATSTTPIPSPRTKSSDLQKVNSSSQNSLENSNMERNLENTLKSKLEHDLKQDFEITLKSNLENNLKSNLENDLKVIEEKLTREVDQQKISLEKILDSKLSGSLQRMEAQMDAFWHKLNSWDKQREQSTPVRSNTSISNSNNKGTNSGNEITFVVPKKSVETVPKLSNIPKPLPRQVKPTLTIENNPPNEILPVKKSITKSILKTLDSSSDESEINLRPTSSFKARLEEKLSERLKQQSSQGIVSSQNQQSVAASKEKIPTLQLSSSEDESNKTFTVDESESLVDKSTKVTKIETKVSKEVKNKTEDFAKRMKKQLESVLSQKLKSIGVSSNWTSLPEKSFKRAMEIVEQQAINSQRAIPQFNQLRKQLEKSIEKEVLPQKKLNNRRNIKSMNRNVENLVPTPPESESSDNLETPLPLTPKIRIINPAQKRKVYSSASSLSEEQQDPNKYSQVYMEENNNNITAKDLSKEPKTDKFEHPLTDLPMGTKKKVIFDLNETDDSKMSNSQEVVHKPNESRGKKAIRDTKGTKYPNSDSSDWDISDIV